MAFNPSRLSLARRRRAFTKRRLGTAVGLTERSIRSYENGGESPSDESRLRMAEELRFPVGFFEIEDDPVEIDPDGASFRSLTTMTARQRDAVLAAASLAIDLNQYIEQRFELPEVDVPDHRDASPEGASRALREHWVLGERPIANMVHLLESKGVRVFSIDREYRTIDAFTTWNRGRPFVFLNTLKTGERGRFDAAHELGHIVLHRHGQQRGRHLENEANAFASAFLMPASKVMALAPRIPTVQRLAHVKAPWRVSVKALARRLNELGVISDWHYRQILIELSKRGQSNEPNPIARETSSLLGQVFASLRARGANLSSLASELRISMTELNSLVFGLTPTAVTGHGMVKRSGVRSKAKLEIVQ